MDKRASGASLALLAAAGRRDAEVAQSVSCPMLQIQQKFACGQSASRRNAQTRLMDKAGTTESRTICENSQGLEISGSVIHLNRHEVVFEVYSPVAVIQSSEALRNFTIEVNGKVAYRGRAVVKTVVHTELKVVCAAALEEGKWELHISGEDLQPGRIDRLFKEHLRQWQKLQFIRPEYKVHVAEMESFFAELRTWLHHVELGVPMAQSNGQKIESDIAQELSMSVQPAIDALFQKFETIAGALDPAYRAVHRAYMQQHLHPLILCAPFVHRTFTKPLGYAGDYEMVNMIARNRPEGASLFAKVVNLYFVRQAPAIAHRNRLKHLTRRLVEESVRVVNEGRTARIFSMACGPALEVQEFVREQEISNRADFTLLDFNEETLEHVAGAFANVKAKYSRRTPVQLVKRSVHHLLRESVKSGARVATPQYDFIYCAGLFDYLTDAVCQRLIALMYDWLAPGGVLLATNVDASLNDLRSFRHSLDFVLDWQLIYRSSTQLYAVVPESLRAECSVKSDETGVNLFLELRRPHNA